VRSCARPDNVMTGCGVVCHVNGRACDPARVPWPSPSAVRNRPVRSADGHSGVSSGANIRQL
jgi:hypothetical protein